MKSNLSRAERQGRTIVNFNDNGGDEADGSWVVSAVSLSFFLTLVVSKPLPSLLLIMVVLMMIADGASAFTVRPSSHCLFTRPLHQTEKGEKTRKGGGQSCKA